MSACGPASPVACRGQTWRWRSLSAPYRSVAEGGGAPASAGETPGTARGFGRKPVLRPRAGGTGLEEQCVSQRQASGPLWKTGTAPDAPALRGGARPELVENGGTCGKRAPHSASRSPLDSCALAQCYVPQARNRNCSTAAKKILSECSCAPAPWPSQKSVLRACVRSKARTERRGRRGRWPYVAEAATAALQFGSFGASNSRPGRFDESFCVVSEVFSETFTSRQLLGRFLHVVPVLY